MEQSAKHVKDIADAVRDADGLFLATDPDREGEAISWHVLDALEQAQGAQAARPSSASIFNAITKKAVLDAMADPRDIDVPLVDAYLARRALDYLVGFNSLAGSLAQAARRAARPAACSRWRCAWSAIAKSEIERFISEEYWNLSAL